MDPASWHPSYWPVPGILLGQPVPEQPLTVTRVTAEDVPRTPSLAGVAKRTRQS